MKRRLLKILLVTAAVAAFTGYFAFSTFLFSPTERDYEADVSTLIPRDVDFYLSKGDLAQAFDPFPELALGDELAATNGGRAFLESPEWQELRALYFPAERAQELDAALASLPLEIDPLHVLGGRDVALAGYFRPQAPGGVDWAVYARGNWMAKLGLALLEKPGLLDLGTAGLQVAAEEGSVALSGGGLARPLHLARVRDVFVAATDAALIQKAVELAAVKGEDSFGGSARYYDHIEQRERDGDELELFVDYSNLSQARKISGNWPDPAAQDFLPAFLGRLFQTGTLKEVAGIAGFDNGPTLALHGDLAAEQVTAFQKVFYRERGFDSERLYQVARFAPEDTALMVYLHAPIGALLRQAVQALEPAARDNLNDLVREVWKHPDVDPLIEELDAALHDRALLILRTDDYPVDADGPPNDGQPVFAWSLVLWTDQASKLEEARRRVIDNQGLFGIQGRGQGEAGVYTNEASGGQLIYEYWSPFLPGTGHLASVTDEGQGFFILSNQHKMLGDVLKTWFEGAPQHPRLSEYVRFEALAASGLPHANVALWVNPRAAGPTLRRMADSAAERIASSQLDWSLERPRIDREVLRANFPEWDYENLTDPQREQLEVLAAPERDHFQRQFRDDHLPAVRSRYERYILYAEAVPGALVELALDPKSIDLFARVLLDLGSS